MWDVGRQGAEGRRQRTDCSRQIAAGRLQQAAFQLGTRHFFSAASGKKSGAEAPQFSYENLYFSKAFCLEPSLIFWVLYHICPLKTALLSHSPHRV